MSKYSKIELENAIAILSSTITNCEKMQLKFMEGTSQHTLLKNRIKALYICRTLLQNEDITIYTMKERKDALAPIVSIISKSTKAQSKYEKGSRQYNRLEPIIHAMKISRSYLENRIGTDL